MSDVHTWNDLVLSEHSSVEVYKILQLRCEVFIVEQNSVVLDTDGRDLLPTCVHLCGWSEDGKLLAYARILGPGTIDDTQEIPVIGRVATHPSARGNGNGKKLMIEAIRVSESRWPQLGCQLGAQAYLESFYSKLGFTRMLEIEPYEHHGIAHIEMYRPSE